jgi:hypothetical protein
VGKILSWIILTPLVLGLVLFAASNRADVVLRLWPFDYELTTPVALVGAGGLFAGFLWGAVTVWISGGVARGRARREAHRADLAEREGERLKTEVELLEEKLRHAEAQIKAAQSGSGAALPAPADGKPGETSRHIL